MRQHIFAIFDTKAEMYQRPFFVVTAGVAFRMLMDEMARGGADNMLAMHTKDFELFHCGDFDDETGVVTAGQPKLVCTLESLKETNDVPE